jgi:glutamine cyclotransferase
MTTDGKHAIMSDGSDQLSFLRAPNMKGFQKLSESLKTASINPMSIGGMGKGVYFANMDNQ